MTKRFKNIPIKERIAVVMLLAVIVTNPLTSQYVLRAILRLFDELMLYGAWVTMVACSYAIALFAWHWFQSEQTKIPAKTKKVKSQDYIATE